MRKFTKPEIAILKNQKDVIFTEFELDLLEKGEAPFKIISQAEKVLEQYRKYLQMPMSRGELMAIFLTQKGFNQIYGKLNDQFLFLTKTLIKKNIITEAEINLTAHEIIAGQWPHLCEACTHDFLICEAEKVKFAKEIFTDLTGKLADKVIQCEKFEKKESQNVITKEERGE
jgi:hypothetical protein